MKLVREVIALAGLLFVIPGYPSEGRGGEETRLDPELPYQAEKKDPVSYRVDFSIVLTAPYHTKLLRVWLPIPPSDAAQDVSESRLSTFPMKVEPRIEKEPLYGNTFAYFEFSNPEGAQVIRHQFRLVNHEMRWNVDPDKVARQSEWPQSFAKYLRSDGSVLVDDRTRQVAFQVVHSPGNEARDIASVIAWTNSVMKYDHAAASLRASAAHALDTKAGHCSDYHGLCSALGRALGYPTRVAYGINAFAKNSPSHCKLEAYLPPYGWVSFDVSETQRLVAEIDKSDNLEPARKKALVKAANDRLFKGFRDNTWYKQTQGTDYELAPPASRRVPVVRTAYMEADGEPLPDPDPANPNVKSFSWMTVHEFLPDHPVKYPFKGWESLEGDLNR